MEIRENIGFDKQNSYGLMTKSSSIRKEINGMEALVEYPGEERRVMVGEKNIKAGDYVLVQMGIIIKTLSKKEAQTSLKAWSTGS